MILTQCTVCATDLGLTRGKKCGRCSTRYCGAACQVQHWKEGGHDQLCKQIKRSGGAEQYNANNKYAQSVTIAAEACAEDTKGQTCYICTQALHWKTKEGLVRGCACRGTAGFAHVSCLAEQAKILVAEAEDNNLGNKVYERFARWHTCSLCEQDYHGVVFCALGWACWKTYLGRPEADEVRTMAMGVLGSGLSTAHRHEDALVVKEAELSMKRRLGAAEASILVAQSNLASTYRRLGRLDDALRLRQDAYSGYAKFLGEEHEHTIREANNYASLLNELKRFEEAKSLLRRMTPVARRVLCEEDRLTIKMKSLYAYSLYSDPGATLDGLREAVTTLEETTRIARRVLGGAHPFTVEIEGNLRDSRAVLSAREGDVEPLRAAVEAMAPGDA